MANDCAVCYVTDLGFLLPSLVSATSLRKFVGPEKADVYIFLVGQDERVEEVNRIASQFDIKVVAFDSRWVNEIDLKDFPVSHVTPAALGRFFLDRGLPEHIKRIVYIDGDTLIRRDPSALIDTIVPEGKFAAAEDMVSFRFNPHNPRGRMKMGYLKAIGVHPPTQGYFNSGVFAVSRATWAEFAGDAFKFFLKNTKACEHYDQSALNASIGNRRLKLSLKWNFQTPFRFLGIEKFVQPAIYHFHSYPKPWMGPCRPWADIYEEYQEAVKPFASLNLPLKKLTQQEVDDINALNWRKKLLLRSSLIAKYALMQLGIGKYQKQAWL